jgi:hypothetical protein
LLMNDARLARIVEQNARFPETHMSLLDYLEEIRNTIRIKRRGPLSIMQEEIAFSTEKLYFNRLLQVAADKKGNQQVSAEVLFFLEHYFYDSKAGKILAAKDVKRDGKIIRLMGAARKLVNAKDVKRNAHNYYLQTQMRYFTENPNDFKAPPPPVVPPGQPIGCDFED